jgi:UDP-2,3-diacylglucosamine pyrophosphatase LpxH
MKKIQSLFISDLHLGNPNSQVEKLLEVFKEYEFKNLFIVGDFIDMTYLKRKFGWKKSHSAVIQKVIKYSRKGVNVVYIIGNHDYFIRSVIDEKDILFGDILLCNEYIYHSIKGEKIFITHGDCFDGMVRVHPILYYIGDKSYELSIRLNQILNFFRKLFRMEYWSLSAYLKTKVKNVVKFLSEYKKMSELMIKDKNCDSIMIGHTHTPDMIGGKYYNTGDFCESCSYIIEHTNGQIELRFCQ